MQSETNCVPRSLRISSGTPRQLKISTAVPMPLLQFLCQCSLVAQPQGSESKKSTNVNIYLCPSSLGGLIGPTRSIATLLKGL